MTMLVTKLLLPVLAVAGFLTTTTAGAVIITGSGVDTTIKHFVIDDTVSTVTHDPGLVLIFGGGNAIPPQPETFSLSGQFDANFSRYWWSYFLDQDPNGTQGSFISEQNWLTLTNSTIVGSISPGGFGLPSYFIRINGTSLSGDEGPCNFPSDPNTSCSGWINGPIASLAGQLDNGTILLQGIKPIAGGNLFENFSYNIQANAIPEPGVLLLLLSGLGGLFLVRRKRQA